MRRWTRILGVPVAILVVAACTTGGGATPGAPGGPASPGATAGEGAEGDACNPPRQEGVTLTFVSFGGAYQEAQRKAWLDPYTALTGVQFQEDENSSNATI
jgi:spermidine/putrescine-binding protein